MSITRQQLAPVISCHAWDSTQQQVAISPNNGEVHIYTAAGSETAWERAHVLTGHDSIVTGIDWSAEQGRLVTCSQDRSAAVWQQMEGTGQWTRQRVSDLAIPHETALASCKISTPYEERGSVSDRAEQARLEQPASVQLNERTSYLQCFA